MDYRLHTINDLEAIVRLFASVFGDSEGEVEGALISRLARDLFEKTDENDLFNFVADNAGRIIGSIFFSRLRFESGIEAFILGPVAVNSDYQGKGIGQALLNYGLKELKARGVSIVLTYGDPNFYHKAGFRSISHEVIRAPFELAQPQGWLGQSLVGDPIETLSGSCTCVEALNNPVYW